MRKIFKDHRKVICTVAAFAVLATAGFMGVERFIPKERSLNIVGNKDLAVSSSVPVENSEAENNEEKLNIDAKAAILIDGTSGEILYGQNEYKHLPPASVTKVMTLLLVMDGCSSGKISLDDDVTISERAASMGGSQMYMEPGETHKVEELLKGVITVSANDGCVALAEHLSGSVESFVKDMNLKAKEMGLKNSNFVNTNGLPVADHYSCAYDIGIITTELMKHEEAHSWFTAWQEDIKVGLPGKESKFTLTNTNKMVRTYNGAIGGKTGFTQDAGYCLTLAANRENTMLIGVVLGSETSDIRFKEMARLLDYGFAKYTTVKIADKGDVVKKVNIEKGQVESINAVTEENIGLTVARGNEKTVTNKIEIDKKIKLPLKKGDKIGTVTIMENDKEKAKYNLVTDRAVKRAGFGITYVRMIKKMI